ncbi:MAG: histidine phosphatase family protein [Candidatus Thorarchaeota archaeon]
MNSEHAWKTVDWLRDARQLVDWVNGQTGNRVMLMIRHSHRLVNRGFQASLTAELTPVGYETSVEFGRRLPTDRPVSIFHSPHIRTEQTAEGIAEGFSESGGNLVLMKDLEILLGANVDPRKYAAFASKIGWSRTYQSWSKNMIPEDTIERMKAYTQRLHPHTLGRMAKDSHDSLHIHVTHDMVVAACRWTYLAIKSDPGLDVQFLGGFGVTGEGSALRGFVDGEQSVEIRSEKERNIRAN